MLSGSSSSISRIASEKSVHSSLFLGYRCEPDRRYISTQERRRMDTTETAQPVVTLVCGVNGCKGSQFIDLGNKALNQILSHEGILSVSRIEDLRAVGCVECGSMRTLDMQTHAKCLVSKNKSEAKQSA